MALAFLAAYLLVPALSETASFVNSEALSLFQRSRLKTSKSFEYSAQDPAARTLLSLDTNHDHSVDQQEIANFALSQGLDAASAELEFSSIDTNGDGVLDATELKNVLGANPSSEPMAVNPAVAVQTLSAAAAPVPKAQPIPTEPLDMIDTRDLSAEIMSEEQRKIIRESAENVAKALRVEANEERQARVFARQASDIQANSAVLARKGYSDALHAGATAARAKADELMAQISKLGEQAERAGIKAGALRAQAKVEFDQGHELMAIAQEAAGRTD